MRCFYCPGGIGIKFAVCAYITHVMQELNFMKTLTGLMGFAALLCSQVLMANTVIFHSYSEPDLIGVGGILDSEFGLGNLLRIDDEHDQFWTVTGSEVSVTVVAKYAGFSQDFGFINTSNNFTSLLYVPHMEAQSNTFTAFDSGSPFRFGLDPSGSPLLSSAAADNDYCDGFHCLNHYDHMVSWLITDGHFAGDYIIAWEDLEKLGDRDYNDLVIRISGASPVPVPAALWLFGAGLLGLAAVAGRRA